MLCEDKCNFKNVITFRTKNNWQKLSVNTGSLKLFGNERVKYLCAVTNDDVIIFLEIFRLGLNFCWRAVLQMLIQTLSVYIHKL
jgi:hypothetical protein